MCGQKKRKKKKKVLFNIEADVKKMISGDK